MKKLFLFGTTLALFVLASCVKERNCSCTTTKSYAGTSTAETSMIVLKDVTKKQAKTLCASSTTTDEKGVVTTKDCKLE